MASLEKYRLAAKGKIAEVVDDYIAGGAGDQPQQNVDGFKKWVTKHALCLKYKQCQASEIFILLSIRILQTSQCLTFTIL